MDSNDIFQGTILKEIMEIKEKNYIDSKHKKTTREKPAGILTNFEKAAFTLYRGDIEKLKNMEDNLQTNKSLTPEDISDLKLKRNILDEKIKIVSKLFTFTVRSRLGIWEGSIIAVRKGFEVVIVHEHWSKKTGFAKAEKIINKEKGATTSVTAHA